MFQDLFNNVRILKKLEEAHYDTEKKYMKSILQDYNLFHPGGSISELLSPPSRAFPFASFPSKSLRANPVYLTEFRTSFFSFSGFCCLH